MVKYKRRPNGSGTVVKLSGRRRKPFCAKVTLDERNLTNGEKKRLVIGTFETYQEALNALSLYSLTVNNTISKKEAMEIDPEVYQKVQDKMSKKVPTFLDIYYILDKDEFSLLSSQTQNSMHGAIKHLKKLHYLKIDQITLRMIQDVFDEDGSNHSTQVHMKTICTKVFRYAVVNQYIERNDDYTSYIRIAKYEESDMHRPYTINEILTLKKADTPEAHIMLIFIYTGVRINELLNINRDNIHIDEKCDDDGTERLISYMITGSKTKAGKNRIVPIHDDIKQFVIDELLKPEKRLVDVTYANFTTRTVLIKVNKLLNTHHTMHDTRKTFATLCQMNNLNVYIRKKVLGHRMNDITFDVYTNESKNRLWTEVNKIKV
ncbi:site-specific integrase [Catenibacterium mitsuokai]|uniref:tyrosine-type recombinase/integrase n=1 Tax=Catenibacterium mitsuokai TaxID=100886 RepID=UPI0002FC9292|nr:site-specific integrase [Catenibacterium mitsuokai]UWO54504.1 site-specific integrase [Catenibacterium mitsuokai]